MKKVIFTLIAVFSVAIAQNLTAQDVETIKLKQTTGKFDKTELNLTAGTTYQFEVMNNGVDHEVGFVLAPANNPDGHIKSAYLKNTVMDGKSAKSGEVTLAAGEYVFFCPMNPTPQYKVTVKEGVETIKLAQTKGMFDKKELNLTAGTTYQFEVMNNGVDHEVGFVLAPANNPDGHIKEAYLANTVMDGKSAKSGEVTLAAGEYVFFCPMNPTPQYKVTVKEGMDKKAMMAKEEMAEKEKMAKEKMAKEAMAKKEMAKKEMAKKEMAAKDMTMEKSSKKVKTIKLSQTPGKFNKKALKLKEGRTYKFEVANDGVDHEVGFVLAPANNPDGHIKDAYLKNTVMDGKSANSGEVTLKAGEYVFFCPMNPTPQYKVTVK